MKVTSDQLTKALHKLHSAVSKGANPTYCLRLWSQFIRLRDNQRCVICHSKNNLNAHHIVRKSFLPEARFQTGNGITLCSVCHREPHEVFNQHPDIDLPMDAQGGENIELLTKLIGILITDAKNRNLLNDEYYYLSEEVLMKFKAFQGISINLAFSGSPLEQAFLIWQQTPRETLNAILQANGFAPLPDDFIQSGSFIIFSEE